MKTLPPPVGLTTLKKEMDRIFDRFFDLDIDGFEFRGLGEWYPPLDVSETKENVLVRVEVPGIDPKDIQVTLEEQVLAVKGERSSEKQEKDERFFRTERAYGSFARSVRLPAPVDGSKVNATYKNGVLIITLPKTAPARGTLIPVKVE